VKVTVGRTAAERVEQKARAEAGRRPKPGPAKGAPRGREVQQKGSRVPSSARDPLVGGRYYVSDMTPAEFAAARQALGWRQWEMAKRLGIGARQARISEWERGKRTIPAYIAEHVRTLLCLPRTHARRKRWPMVINEDGTEIREETWKERRSRELAKGRKKKEAHDRTMSGGGLEPGSALPDSFRRILE
jgi:transcriptional regulator with XRE-family HTH domain